MSTLSKANRPTTHLWLIIFVFIFSLSPLLSSLIKVPGNYLYLFPLALFILVNYKSISFDLSLILIALIIILFAFIPTMYFGALKYLLVPIYILIALPVMTIIKTKDWVYLISIISKILIFFEILAIISFLIYYFSILSDPIFCIENEDSRLNCLYGATMTNWQSANIIRPSAIYDEPGAFSFIICMTVLLRIGLKMSNKVTFKLLIFGMITFSIAHFLFMLLYFLNRLFLNEKIRFTKSFVITLFVVITVIFSFGDVIYSLILSRFEIIDGVMVGENRLERMLNTLSLINFKSFFVGIGPSCVLTGYECYRSEIGVFDSNPFTLLAAYGIFLSSPYYFIIFKYLQNSLHKADFFIMLGAIMLIMQRPNVMAYGYALIVVSSIFIFLKKYRPH